MNFHYYTTYRFYFKFSYFPTYGNFMQAKTPSIKRGKIIYKFNEKKVPKKI